MTTLGEYMSLEEAADVLGVSVRTVQRRIATGTLPLYRTGANQTVRLLLRADVEALREPRKEEIPEGTLRQFDDGVLCRMHNGIWRVEAPQDDKEGSVEA